MDDRIVRVLVVDDFEKWREYVCATIQEIPGLQVVGEAADGLEAIQKSKDLRPHLILLDISLPRLDGIEVARRLSQVCPESRIIFVTENRSSDIREEGFRAGGSAFVIKSESASELIAAINAVLKRRES
ncbi:MAG TPA: response regulator transcription factor [Terriglobales bacterium]|nr:response regulator transcription factor [Terriglobales bacterium]